MLAYVVENARQRLRDQLQCALAADQRALVLAGLAISAAVVLAGGGIAMAQQGLTAGIGVPFGLALLLLLGAAGLAIWTARPTRFFLSGDLPRTWRHDLAKGASLADVLPELAADLNDRIEKNETLLAGNGRLLLGGLCLALGAAALAVAAGVAVVVA